MREDMRAILMCEQIKRVFNLDRNIEIAIQEVDREIFVPVSMKSHAYSLQAIPMEYNQWISSPLTVAKMTQYLLPAGADSVLEIGCGSGYQAMILSKLIRRVFTIERIEGILLEAQKRIRQNCVYNINTKLGDGQIGWRDYAPYERVLFSACVSGIPSEIVSQMMEDAVLVAPIKDGSKQFIKRFRKRNGKLDRGEVLEECSFVPILDGISR